MISKLELEQNGSPVCSTTDFGFTALKPESQQNIDI